MTPSEHLHVGGKLIGAGHPGTLNEDGNHANVSLKRGGDLAQHPILRIIVGATSTPLMGHGAPIATDDRYKGVAPADCLGDHLGEIGTGRGAVKVSVHVVRPEALHKAVVDPPGMSRRIRPAVTDENSGQ
jgi:hypothetical protein